MNNNNRPIKEHKEAVITIRVSSATKKKLKKKACNSGISLSEYLITHGLDDKIQPSEKNKADIFSAVIMQQICSHIEEHYGADKHLEEWSRKLWENL